MYLKERLYSLIDVRKLTAILIVVLFIVLSLLGTLEVNFIQTVIISVISFYFGKSTALDTPKEGDK
jgi:quinol-cytochrome oxidoreductase complex cytochrome b subunit